MGHKMSGGLLLHPESVYKYVEYVLAGYCGVICIVSVT